MPDSDWLTKLKYTMSLDVGRFIAAQWPPRAIVDGLFEIPEVRQAFHLRENRRRPLAVDPGTDEQRQEIVDALAGSGAAARFARLRKHCRPRLRSGTTLQGIARR